MKQPKFKVGDKVVYTNEYGVCWGVKTITKVEWSDTRRWTYYKTPTDCPWFASEEERFSKADAEDLRIEKHPFSARFFQKKYGFPITNEQRASLLDEDPFEGEQ